MLFAAAGAVAPDLGARFARRLVVDLGPNDADYVRGFREDWERDGRTRFHWTSTVASVVLPYRLSGDGFQLRARVRRHFVEPAQVRLIVEDRTVHDFSIQADPTIPYRVESVPLGRLQGLDPFRLAIQARSENPQPLGVAIDWIEIEHDGESRLAPLASMRWRAAALTLVALLAPWLLGSFRLGAAHGISALVAIAAGTAVHAVAAERVLREGMGTYAAVAAGTVAILMLLRWRSPSTSLGSRLAPALAVVLLAGLAVRLALLLHPQFFYPDVRIHAVFARALARQGFVEFMRDFTTNQFRYSLGLQLEQGHWYAFPYPPAFYLLAGPLVRWLGYVPEVAVSVVAASLNATSALLVFGIGRRLGLGPRLALASAAVVPLLPLFTTRLSLAYFPAMAGQFMDAAVILYLLGRRRELDRPRVVLGLAALVGLAMLTYTQSIVNFALLFAVLLSLQFAFDRASWRRHIGLAAAGALGAILSLAMFYGRYLPVFVDMQRGVPMQGEAIVLERIAQQEKARLAAGEEVERDNDDPFTGADLNPVRGVRKALWRFWIFYGPFALAVAMGFLLLIERSDAEAARFALAWASVYVLLNLGSAGLPGPNLLRYNKDLEIVAPLFCVCLALTGHWLWARARIAGAAYAVAYVLWGVQRALAAFEARVVVER